MCAFGAGRHSVRRAVASLAVEGKLRVEQGRGTFVEAAPLITYQIGRRTRFRQNLLEQGISPKGEHISAEIIPAPLRVASALGIAEGTLVHRILRRGFADGVPLNLGMAFHEAAVFPDLGAGGRAARRSPISTAITGSRTTSASAPRFLPAVPSRMRQGCSTST